MDRYCIPDGYRVNRPLHLNKVAAGAVEGQADIYRHVRARMDAAGLSSIVDVGCGSGRKLESMFGGLSVTGTELEPALSHLRASYAWGTWIESDFDSPPPGRFDVALCADVVEHVEDPDRLMSMLAGIDAGVVFVSTPVRPARAFRGPPANRHHIREWSAPEFRAYASKWFSVVDQRVMDSQLLELARR